MPGEKAEIVEEGWRAINRGDVDAVLDFMTDDVDLRPGVPVNQRAFTVYTFRERKIAAIIAYPGEREALEAVGLSGDDAHADSA
jgi:ketosteroid isomerase-like protein